MKPDPFRTLGLAPRFSIDLEQAAKRHRDLSRALHPDRYVGRPPAERRLALSRAIEVNDSWRAVRDPVTRAEALIRLAGLDPDQGHPNDPAFLMEVMEWQEAIAEAKAEGDQQALTNIEKQLADRQDSLLSSLAQVLDDPERPRSEAIAPLGQLRFIRRMLQEISLAQEDTP